MTIEQAQEQIVSQFQDLQNWEDRYKKIIALGKELPSLPEEYYTDKYKVNGCQSQVWLHAKMQSGKIVFIGDSDAMIVKGLLAILLKIFSERSPEEVMQTTPDFITKIGLNVHLSQSRSNGVAAMIKQMKLYALALHTMQSKEN
ncbi:MAG: SufE family protein [Bdellovibrionales bacterium]|nr:SufE family protein [Bdellovibrionales bacterium]